MASEIVRCVILGPIRISSLVKGTMFAGRKTNYVWEITGVDHLSFTYCRIGRVSERSKLNCYVEIFGRSQHITVPKVTVFDWDGILVLKKLECIFDGA